MRSAADQTLSYNLAASARLNRVFREEDPEVICARISLATIAISVLLVVLMLIHIALDLPGPAFLWQLILSLCS